MKEENSQLWITTMIGLMLFFATISTNYIGELMSCKNQRFLTHSRKMKHLIGIFALFLFVVMSMGKMKYHPIKLLLFSAIGYVVFILVTKTSFPSGLLGFSLFFVVYMFELVKKYEQENMKDKKLAKKRRKKYLEYQKIIGMISACILIYSLCKYYLKQKQDHGDDFKIGTFFFGVNKCENIDKPLKYFK